ncbi:DNA polymerase III subunit delta [bacterium]|nr:DNA polymerase III subunit delta [bacterium]
MPPRKIRAADFAKLATSGGVGPVCVALGDEPLLLDHVERAARTIPDETTRDFNMDVLYGDGLDVRELAPALSALPMMAEQRVVIVKRADAVVPTVQKYLTDYAANPVDSTLLLLLINSDGKAAWIKKLAGMVDVVDCTTPRGKALTAWAAKAAERFGVRIDDAALDLLADSGGRLIELHGELLKASLLIEEGETITPDVLQRVWGIEEEVNIWSFFDHVAAGDRLVALREVDMLKDHLSQQSGFFFSQIARRWRMIVKERLYDQKRTPMGERKWSGNTKRQWQMMNNNVKPLPLEYADNQLKRMLELDRARKTRSFDDEIGFAAFVHNISLDRKEAQ